MPVTNLESSSIKLKRHTGSAGFAPPSLLEGEFAINLIDGNLYYGTQGGDSVSQNFAFANITSSANISSSGYISSSGAFFDGDIKVIGTGSFDVIVTNYESSSIIYSSGSTKFGDTLDDTHEFTGSVFISASEFYITGGNGGLTYDVDSSPPSLYVGGGITASGDISSSQTLYSNNLEVATDTTISGDLIVTDITSSGDLIVVNITSSGNISSSQTLYSNNLEVATDTTISGDLIVTDITSSGDLIIVNITSSGNISSSQTLYSNTLEVTTDATLSGDLIVTDITSSNISASGYISSSGAFFSGDVKIIGTASVDTLITNYSASTIYASGSTTFGDSTDDLHIRTGSMLLDGLLFVDNSITSSGDLLVTDITSSGNISSSQTLYSNNLEVTQDITASNITASSTIYSNNLEVTTDVTISGDLLVTDITASSISASSHISASEVYADTGDFRVVSASEYFGITPTQYKTGSDSNTSLDLSLFQIKNYDTDIFVTASGTQLILQFGTPKVPTLGDLTDTGFRTDRFAGPFVDGSSIYVIDNDYTLSFGYTLDPTNTFSSGSLLANINGVPQEIATDDVNDGTLSFNINGSTYETYLHSGSHGFTGSLEVELADGSKQSFQTTPLSLTISKDNPNIPPINSIFYNSLEKTTTYVTNTGANNTATSKIEEGITGTITYNSGSGNSNGWDLDRVDDNSPGDPQSLIINETNAPTISLTAYYDTNNSGDNPSETDTNVSNSKNYTRIRSIRSGASPNSASLTEDEIHDITAWVDGDEIEDGNIQFDTTDIVNDTTFVSITNTSVAYYYIIYDSNEADLTALRQGSTEGSNVLVNWTKSTVGNYKVYRLNLKTSPVTDNKFYLYN